MEVEGEGAGFRNPNLSKNSSSPNQNASGDEVSGRLTAPGMRPVERSSEGSRTSMRRVERGVFLLRFCT